jgi:hypothetical protein
MMDKHDLKEDRSDQDEPLREGEVLGLGGSVVPKSATDPVTEFDDESIARRRARAQSTTATARVPLPRANRFSCCLVDMNAARH